MAYTTLRITRAGVVLLNAHRARFAADGEEAEKAFLSFVAEAEPGIWSVRWADGELTTSRREASMLFDDIPVRFLVSPFATSTGPHPKPASPSPYDAVRTRGRATLLTSSDGKRIFESCTAAVVGWDGEKLVLTPEDSPRVDSTSEKVIRQHLDVRTRPILVESDLPIALVNAVAKVVRVNMEGRQRFPDEAAATIQRVFEDETKRP